MKNKSQRMKDRKLNQGEQGWHVILWKVIFVSELTAIIFKTYVLPFGAGPQTHRPSWTHNLVSARSWFSGEENVQHKFRQ